MDQVEIAGRYIRRGTVGTGAGTVVYEAFDRLIERRVAVKVVTLPPVDDPETAAAIARFRRGAKAAGGLNHPNIVAVFDYGEDAEQAWIVMELIEGGSLKALLDSGERLSVPKIVQLMGQVLDALGYSHAKGVVHRDIKPANIMLTSAGMAKITDFGIARLENSSMTHAGTMMGTPAYMAPEQFRGESVDLRADIWAAGVVLYQLLTGEKPFGGGITSIMQKALYTEPVPPSRARVPTGTAAFDAVVARAMAKSPADRFASAAEFNVALRRAAEAPDPAPASDATVLESRPYRSVPVPQRSPAGTLRQQSARRRILPWIGGAVVVLGLAAAGGVLLLEDRMPENRLPQDRLLVDRQPESPQAATGTAPPEAPAEPPSPAMPAAPQMPAAVPLPPPEIRQAVAPPGPDLNTVAAAVGGAPCSLLRVTLSGDTISVAGVVRLSEANAISRTIEAFGIPPAAARLSLDTFSGQFCEALTAIRPVAVLGNDLPGITLTSPNPLRGGQALRFSVQTPDWAARLHVAYVTDAGEVGHLVQAGPAYPARSAVPFGDAGRWTATAPFGTDMLILVASERPLFPQRRRGERLEDFTPALLAALREAQEGGRVAARIALVSTVPPQ